MDDIFEWDEQKNQANLSKHGIAFETDAALWDDEDGIELQLIYVEEPRTLRITSINNVIWSAIFTVRDQYSLDISQKITR